MEYITSYLFDVTHFKRFILWFDTCRICASVFYLMTLYHFNFVNVYGKYAQEQPIKYQINRSNLSSQCINERNIWSNTILRE